jgi:hypothetical protein
MEYKTDMTRIGKVNCGLFEKTVKTDKLVRELLGRKMRHHYSYGGCSQIKKMLWTVLHWYF